MWRCFLLTLLGAGVLAAGAGLLWQEFLWHGVDRFFQVPEASMEPPTPMDARGLPARTLDEEPEAAGPLEEDENELEPEQELGPSPEELDEVNDSQDPQTDERPRTSSAWFLQDPMSEPPGFPAFRREVEAQQRSATQWVVFSGFNGIGNWMLGAASGLLISALLHRGYAVLGAKGASGGLCHWMRSPLCDWEAPEWVMAKVRRQLELLKEQRKRRSAKAAKYEEGVEVMQILWKGCKFERLLCGQVSSKPILLLLSGAWLGEVLLQNPAFQPRMQSAFQRQVDAGRDILDVYGPLSRWLFGPSPEVARDLDSYVAKHLRSGKVSVCLQGRWGNSQELRDGKRCIDTMMAQPWWPGKTVVHVASMKASFRSKVQEAFAGDSKVSVVWPSWDAKVRGQRDNLQAYQDMLLAGRCQVVVAPNGGSTFTYASTAMYHSVSLRDAGRGKMNCSNLPWLPYEKLFPEPRAQLDLDKKCRKRMTRVYNPYSAAYRNYHKRQMPDEPPKPFRLPDKFWEPTPLQVRLANERITFRDLDIMQHFLADNGYILPRRTTMLSRKKQGELVKAVSTAQHMCIIPFRNKLKDYQVMPLMDPLQWMADRLTDRACEAPENVLAAESGTARRGELKKVPKFAKLFARGSEQDGDRRSRAMLQVMPGPRKRRESE
ncbi:unnamed protein product [Effrenium voratum]|nr:unnamed protein product [Effrenium voratum]